MLKFIVLSDLHVVTDGNTSHSLDTFTRFTQAIDHINTHQTDAAFCVIAGDITDFGEVEAYERVKTALGDLKLPVYMTLGNHDDRRAFDQVFPGSLNTDLDRAVHSFTAQGHRIIILDTLDQGAVSGTLGEPQLAWLGNELAASADMPVIVVLHHCPVDLQSPMDFIKLTDGEALASVLKTHGDVRSVISGHVHMTTSGLFYGVPFATIAGSHYSFETRLELPISDVPRRDGPAEYGVVFSDNASTVLHNEAYLDAHDRMSMELFAWDEDE